MISLRFRYAFGLIAVALAFAFVAAPQSPAVTLRWDDISDNPDANGATSYLTASGFTGGNQFILNGHEGSIYFDFSWVSASDVSPISGHGVDVYLSELGTTTVSDWAHIDSLTKSAASAGLWTYSISGFFQSDSPGNGMPSIVPTGFSGVTETGGYQDVTGQYQFQDFSGPPYPIVTATLPSDLSILVRSDVDRSVPDGGTTLGLFAVALAALGLLHRKCGLIRCG